MLKGRRIAFPLSAPPPPPRGVLVILRRGLRRLLQVGCPLVPAQVDQDREVVRPDGLQPLDPAEQKSSLKNTWSRGQRSSGQLALKVG